jgi:hypothetical protein
MGGISARPSIYAATGGFSASDGTRGFVFNLFSGLHPALAPVWFFVAALLLLFVPIALLVDNTARAMASLVGGPSSSPSWTTSLAGRPNDLDGKCYLIGPGGKGLGGIMRLVYMPSVAVAGALVAVLSLTAGCADKVESAPAPAPASSQDPLPPGTPHPRTTKVRPDFYPTEVPGPLASLVASMNGDAPRS